MVAEDFFKNINRLIVFSAHPDDESTSFGGTLALAASRGIETTVITSTYGELGDNIDGLKPTDTGHNQKELTDMRREELQKACRILHVKHHEFLGYRDSGMREWKELHTPATFIHQSLDAVGSKIALLLEKYNPDIILTHNAISYHQHADHRFTGVAVQYAIDNYYHTRSVPLYFKLHDNIYWDRVYCALHEIGINTKNIKKYDEAPKDSTVYEIDTSEVADLKFQALHAHVSQKNSTLATKLPLKLFTQALSHERYYKLH